jgi:hypothetical protein
VLTADALHTQVALVAGVVAQGGDVVLTVKANQPTLYADLAASFADPHTPCTQAHSVDRRRGRVECRQLRVSSELVAYLDRQSRWPHVAKAGARPWAHRERAALCAQRDESREDRFGFLPTTENRVALPIFAPLIRPFPKQPGRDRPLHLPSRQTN